VTLTPPYIVSCRPPGRTRDVSAINQWKKKLPCGVRFYGLALVGVKHRESALKAVKNWKYEAAAKGSTAIVDVKF